MYSWYQSHKWLLEYLNGYIHTLFYSDLKFYFPSVYSWYIHAFMLQEYLASSLMTPELWVVLQTKPSRSVFKVSKYQFSLKITNCQSIGVSFQNVNPHIQIFLGPLDPSSIWGLKNQYQSMWQPSRIVHVPTTISR